MISTTIDQEIKKAMLAKNSAQLRGLRAIKAAILLAKNHKYWFGNFVNCWWKY